MESETTPPERRERGRRRVRPLKDHVLAEWRGGYEPENLDQFSKGIGSILQSTMNKLGLKERLDDELIGAAWCEIVGNFMAGQSAPVELRRKVLLVQVLQPAIHYSLVRLKGQILGRLQERFGVDKVSDLRFRIG
ncbi:MAG: DUF721 domain-containing protein [Verrucomicrobiales bacterium]